MSDLEEQLRRRAREDIYNALALQVVHGAPPRSRVVAPSYPFTVQQPIRFVGPSGREFVIGEVPHE